MNTEVTIHPRLQHYGLTTAKLDAMLEWYRKVIGVKGQPSVGGAGGSPEAGAVLGRRVHQQ